MEAESNQIDGLVLTKTALLAFMNTAGNRVKYEDGKGKSVVWNNFKTVLVDGAVQPFAKCNNCDTVLAYKKKTGIVLC